MTEPVKKKVKRHICQSLICIESVSPEEWVWSFHGFVDEQKNKGYNKCHTGRTFWIQLMKDLLHHYNALVESDQTSEPGTTRDFRVGGCFRCRHSDVFLQLAAPQRFTSGFTDLKLAGGE